MSSIFSSTPFVPHPYEAIVNSFPPGAMPEAAYAQLCKKYAALGKDDPAVSRITYDSDGLAVTGMTAMPARIQPGSHPIAIYNRGGSRQYGILTVFEAIRQLIPLAAQGYLTFASNYRGNDGGEGHEEFGGSDVNDILNLIAIARQQPGWDGRNIFMVGHSRGGMMTYLSVKRGAPVTAAVVISAPSDLFEWAKERPELADTIYQQLIRGSEDKREEKFRERSALYWPEKLKAVPFLLLHGDRDEAVPASHSLRMAEAMKAAEVVHELHIYESGNHALVRQWDDVKQRMLGWMERHRVRISAGQKEAG